MFAHYLTTISGKRISRQFELILPKASFPLDRYFLILTKRNGCVSIKSNIYFKAAKQCSHRKTNSLVAYRSVNPITFKENLIEALREYAVEFITKFYIAIQKDFGFQCNTAVCYRALYLYKCRRYDEVMHLCEEILHEPDLHDDLKKLDLRMFWLYHRLTTCLTMTCSLYLDFTHSVIFYRK